MPLRKEVVEIIEIDWDGPFTLDEVIDKCIKSEDCGIYQVYGTHEVSGPDSLLYIGKTTQNFSARMRQEYDWLENWIPSEVKVYLGRLGGVEKIAETEWTSLIDKVERLLIFFASPPYNSQFITGRSLAFIGSVVILNFGRRHRLPTEVSTLAENSNYFDESKWQEYGGDHLL
jgi:hypothetical protein